MGLGKCETGWVEYNIGTGAVSGVFCGTGPAGGSCAQDAIDPKATKEANKSAAPVREAKHANRIYSSPFILIEISGRPDLEYFRILVSAIRRPGRDHIPTVLVVRKPCREGS